MLLPVRLHDAADRETVLARLLPVLAGPRRERRAAYAEYDRERNLLPRRWATVDEGVEAHAIELEPSKLHSLLLDDAGGDRPLRPVDSAPAWVLRDLLPGLEPDKFWVRARAVADQGVMMGVLVVAEPRRWMLSPRDEQPVQAAGDVLEMALARAAALSGEGRPGGGVPDRMPDSVLARLRESESQTAQARAEVERSKAQLEALERAASGATELLMDAHVELDRRTARHQRQTRVLFLLRKLLDRHSQGLAPRELAVEIVRTVAEAFGGGRCSLLLVDESGADQLRLGAAIGLPPAVEADHVRVPMGEGIAGRVANSRVPLVVRDPGEGDPHPMVRDDWYTSPAFVSLPLCSRGRLVGVLNLTNFRSGTVDDAEVEQLRLVSLCVALLVDHASLADRLFTAAALP